MEDKIDRLKISRLSDLYGDLLTKKQKEILAQYYDLDYSLTEIAENFSISRQAVRDFIKKAENALLEFEQKLKFLSKCDEVDAILNQIKAEIDKTDSNYNEITSKLDSITMKLRS